MKKITILCFIALFTLCNLTNAANKFKLAGANPAAFAVIYSNTAEAEEGINAAQSVSKSMSTVTGKELPVIADNKFIKGKAITLTHSKDKKPFEYTISTHQGAVTIDAGGCWAMEKAGKVLAYLLQRRNIPNGFTQHGTVEGEFLFPRGEGVNLRILDDNIWDYSKSTNAPVWEKAGIDCRDDHRAPQFAQLVRAYMPDVISLQEYNKHMHDRFFPLIEKWGYVITSEGDPDAWNNTPIFYNKENIELVESKYNLYTPAKWSNSKSKSYTYAIFKQKATGKTFGVISTHLWWKNNKIQPGSTQARAAQVRLILAEVEILKAKYDCPFFVMGDMNCEEPTAPIQQFLQEGYNPCYKVATVYGNKDNGHHQCFPDEVGVRTSHRVSAERSIGAIDHCFIYNEQGKAEVKVFDCIQAAFTVLLTDHYPNLIDAQLK